MKRLVVAALWYLSLVAVGVGSATLGLWASDRSPPVRRIALEILPPHVDRGNHVHLSLTVDRVRSCPSRIERWIVDANRYRHVLDDVDFQSAPGPLGLDSYKVRLDAPISAAPGPAVLRSTITAWCNPLHRIWPLVDAWEVPIVID